MRRTSGFKTRLVWLAVVAAVLTGGTAKADFVFGEPTNLGATVNGSSDDLVDCISTDGLEMYFDSNRSGGYGGYDIWVAVRQTVDDDWSAPRNIGPPVNTSRHESLACVSADGLELYVSAYNWPGGHGHYDICVARRATRDGAWGTPQNLGPLVNTSGREEAPWLSTDGLELYFSARNRVGGYGSDDIWVAKRETVDDPWESPANLGPVVNGTSSEAMPCLSADGRALFFSESYGQPSRPGGFGSTDMWVTTRPSRSGPWSAPVNLGPVLNTTGNDAGIRVSPDGFAVYFGSDRPGGYGGSLGDTWQAAIIPLLDFNGDGKVDGFEVCVMANHWGMGESLCDIGPMPWGDGLVDVEDLKVLAEYIGGPVDDPTLVAHWALDETEGMVAADSAGESDGTVMGVPTWQPDGGEVGGALEFDGATFVVAGSVLDPSDGPFSVLAWVEGGAGGQAIVSQQGGANWLMTDELGCLMTELKSASRLARLLGSGSSITDGNWHRIGFTWDGTNRRLYVDSVLVAEDTDIGLAECSGGLNIGAGSSLALATFWEGLIDDVRIYNRAVRP